MSHVLIKVKVCVVYAFENGDDSRDWVGYHTCQIFLQLQSFRLSQMIFNVDYIFHLVVKSLEGGQQIFGEFLLGDDKLSFNLTDTIDHPILAQVGVEGYYSVVVPGKDQIDK